MCNLGGLVVVQETAIVGGDLHSVSSWPCSVGTFPTLLHISGYYQSGWWMFGMVVLVLGMSSWPSWASPSADGVKSRVGECGSLKDWPLRLQLL